VSVGLSVYPSVVTRQRLDKNYRSNEYKRNNRGIVERVVLCAVRVISKENRRLVLPRTTFFLRNSAPPQQFSIKFGSLWEVSHTSNPTWVWVQANSFPHYFLYKKCMGIIQTRARGQNWIMATIRSLLGYVKDLKIPSAFARYRIFFTC
jgi:hypothetical protein